MMTGFTLLLSPLIGRLRERAGSVFGASIFHGVVNAVAPVSVLTVSADSAFSDGIFGLPGFVVLALANLVLIWSDRKSTRIEAAPG